MTISSIQSFLILLPNNLGDVIMAVPVINGLKDAYPGCRVSFFVEKGFEAGLLHNPFLDEIILFTRKEIKSLLTSSHWQLGIDQLSETACMLREKKFDVIINLSQHEYISYLCGFLGSESTIFGRRFLAQGVMNIPDVWSQYLYAIPFSRKANALHATDVYRRIAGCTHTSDSFQKRICITERERKESADFLIQAGVTIASPKIAFVQPGTAYPAKRWAKDSFVSLCKRMIENNWQIVISGSEQEKDLTFGIVSDVGPGCISTAGKTSFRQACANLTFGTLCISADTALMHAAAAVGCKTIALFGSTNPIETGPYGSDHVVFCGECSTSVCHTTECKTMQCMESIDPLAVAAAAEGTLIPSSKYYVFRTEISAVGQYKLKPLNECNNHLIDELSATITEAFVKKEVVVATDMHRYPHANALIAELKEFVTILIRMRSDLAQYQKSRSVQAIRDFETHKRQLATFVSSVSQFFTALLNIKLNSIPLLEMTEAIQLSHDTVDEFISLLNQYF